MGKSQETFNKKDREKKKAKKRKEKLERREMRKRVKADRGKLAFEDQIMYTDQYGNLVREKPDPNAKIEINLDDINLGAAPNSHESFDVIRRGKVKFFEAGKDYGFITDKMTKESIFVHISDAYDDIRPNHIVEFEMVQGHKGKKAINVVQIKA